MESLLPASAFSPDAVLDDLVALLVAGDERVRDTLARHWPMLLGFLSREAAPLWQHVERCDRDAALGVLERFRS